MRTLCLRLGLPRSEWTHDYFIQGLRPEIRDYVILQQADHLDEAENFAQLNEFHRYYFMDSACWIFTRVGVVSEIERVSAANE